MVCRCTEACKVVPDALEVLFGVVAAAGGVTDESGCEVTVVGEFGAEVDVALAAVVRVPAEFGEGKPKPRCHSSGQGSCLAVVSTSVLR